MVGKARREAGVGIVLSIDSREGLQPSPPAPSGVLPPRSLTNGATNQCSSAWGFRRHCLNTATSPRFLPGDAYPHSVKHLDCPVQAEN